MWHMPVNISRGQRMPSQCSKSNGNKVTLITEEVQKCLIENFLGETLNLVVLGSGCSKTVCGEEWLNCYLDTSSEKEQKEIQTAKSDTEFKFGDGKSVSSERYVSFPCRIAGKSVTVETDVVKSEIPLLLSKNSMKKANTKIEFANDKVNIFGKEVDLQFISSGHYATPLRDICKGLNSDLKESQLTEVLLTIDNNIARKSNKEKQQIAIKLHRQFGHPQVHA